MPSVKNLQEYWEKTQVAATKLIPQPHRFILKIANQENQEQEYPCWIGHKDGPGNAALLIAKSGDPEPKCRQPGRIPISITEPEVVGDTGYVLYHFKNETRQYETYVEFQNYMWARKPIAELYSVDENYYISNKPDVEGRIGSGEINNFL